MQDFISVYNFINRNSIKLEGKGMELEDTYQPLKPSFDVQDESSDHVEMIRITWVVFLPWSPSLLSSASHIANELLGYFITNPESLVVAFRQALQGGLFSFLGEDTVLTAWSLPWWVTATLVANASVPLGCWFCLPRTGSILRCGTSASASFQSLGSAHSPLLRAAFIFICYLFSWLMKLHPSGCQYKMLKKKLAKMHKVDERCWASFISWNTNLNNFTLWSREKELNKKSAHTLSHTHTNKPLLLQT